MKKIWMLLPVIAIFWCGCKETDVPLVFSTTAAVDSTYAGPVPATTDPHNVLVEEYTGESCPNCPAAHTLLDGYVAHSGGAGVVNVVSMYFFGNPQGNPPAGARYDFQDSTATNIANAIYGVPSALPAAGIDRMPYMGNLLQQGSSLWGAAITAELAVPDSLNLAASSTYNSTTGMATVKVTVTYTHNEYLPNNISVYLLEDSLVDFQENLGVVDSNYLFLDVFRGMVNTAPLGDAVLSSMSMKPAGQVYWRKFTFSPAAYHVVDVSRCRIVAFVHVPGTGGSYRVLQSVSTRLAP